MAVRMRMPFARLLPEGVSMLMVLIVRVAVLMLHRVVPMDMLMPLR